MVFNTIGRCYQVRRPGQLWSCALYDSNVLKMSSKIRHLLLATAILFVGTTAYGQQVIYEGFEYVPGSNLASQNSGTGWGGGWTTTQINNNATVHSVGGALTFEGLEVTGAGVARATRSGQSSASRTLSPASIADLTADNSTVWFSVLVNAVVGDGQHGNTFGTIVFGSQQLNATGSGANNGAGIGIANNGDAFGVGFGGTNGSFDTAMVQGVSFENGNLMQSIADREVVGANTTLLVGKIDWAANGSADTMTVYLVDDVASPLNEVLTTMTIDVDQAQFDTISIADGQTSAFDEIRFGATLDDVLPADDSGPVDPGGPGDSDGPNIIYIIVDDMGYSDLGCYGGEIDTPNIDSLAAGGLSFRHFYNNAKCETTRSSVMTGLYHGRGTGTSAGATLAEALKPVGYQNYAVGKWHLGAGAGIPVRQGFDHFYGIYGGFADYFPAGIGTNVKRDTATNNEFVSAYPDSSFSTSTGTLSTQNSFPADYYMTDGFGDNAVSFIQDSVTNHPDKPFFLYLAFNAPHTPLQAPIDLINKYRNNGTYDAGWDQLRQEKWERQKALGLVDPEWKLPELRDDIPQWSQLTAAEREQEIHRRAVYAAMMDSVDQNVGKVLQQLADSGIADDTLVIFTGDNGAQAFDNTSNRNQSPSAQDSRWSMGPAWAAFSNAPFRYYKQSQHQGGICTPLIARWPNTIAPGTMTDQPGHVVDIMATFVDIADADYDSLTKDNGQPVPPMDGASLLPIFEGDTRPVADFWGFEFGSSDFGVIQGDWKLVAFSSGPWRLYDLKNDRTETDNLRFENPDKVEELATLYDMWAIDTYGNTSRTYGERDTRSQLAQELRYTKVLGGGIFRQPGIDISLSNIGSGQSASMNDHWEFYLTSTSAAGLAGTADSVTFANKPLAGDGQIIAQVDSMSGMTANGNAGVMIRESLNSNSPLVMIGVKPNGDLVQSVRTAAGQAVTTTTIANASVTLPAFFKITREGDQFTPCYSNDLLTWTSLPAVSADIDADALGGLSTSSGNNGTRAAVTFREWKNRASDSDCPGGFGLGDVNRDGAVDFDDISPFITLLATGQFACEADVDRSGIVDFDDIAPFIGLLSGG